MARDSYVPHRGALYGILWVMAVIELGLTAYRIHHTKSTFGTYDPIIVALLVTAILTMLWVPATLLLNRSALGSSGTTSNRRFGFLHGETSGNLVLWIMWLVNAAIATNRWPKRSLAGPGKQGSILLTIIAFAWMEFAWLTLAEMFAAMEFAAANATGGSGGLGPSHVREKPANGTVTNNAAAPAPAENA